MPCSHTFCAGCIRKLAAPVACPTCRRPCLKPVSDLLPNFALVDVIDAARTTAKGGAMCVLCEGDTHAAVHRCTDPACAGEASALALALAMHMRMRGKMANVWLIDWRAIGQDLMCENARKCHSKRHVVVALNDVCAHRRFSRV